MERNIWNKQRYRFLQKDSKILFDNTKHSYRHFNSSEQEMVESFVDQNECDFYISSPLECQLTSYFVEDRDELDELIVHRFASKIIMN